MKFEEGDEIIVVKVVDEAAPRYQDAIEYKFTLVIDRITGSGSAGFPIKARDKKGNYNKRFNLKPEEVQIVSKNTHKEIAENYNI